MAWAMPKLVFKKLYCELKISVEINLKLIKVKQAV